MAFKELDTVILKYPISGLPKDCKGTIVHIYADGKSYEVEFTSPISCTILLQNDNIIADTKNITK